MSAGNVMIEQDHPLIKAEKGDFFVPQEREWTTQRIKWLWIAIDAALVAGFLLMAVLLSL